MTTMIVKLLGSVLTVVLLGRAVSADLVPADEIGRAGAAGLVFDPATAVPEKTSRRLLSIPSSFRGGDPRPVEFRFPEAPGAAAGTDGTGPTLVYVDRPVPFAGPSRRSGPPHGFGKFGGLVPVAESDSLEFGADRLFRLDWTLRPTGSPTMDSIDISFPMPVATRRVEIDIVMNPEPTSFVLLGAGLAAVALWVRRARRRRA